MKEKLQRLIAFALALGLISSLAFGTNTTPAYAQAENGILKKLAKLR